MTFSFGPVAILHYIYIMLFLLRMPAPHSSTLTDNLDLL